MKYPKEWQGFYRSGAKDGHRLHEFVGWDSFGGLPVMRCVGCDDLWMGFTTIYNFQYDAPLTPAAREVAAEIKAWGSK